MAELGRTLQLLLNRLVTLFVDPTSNLSAAFVLYGIIALAVLILLIIAILYIMSTPEEGETEVGEASRPKATSESRVSRPRAPRPPVTARTVWLRVGVTAALLLGVVIVTGLSTSQRALCLGCHAVSPHAAADVKRDTHATVACVGCHEPMGTLGRYTSAVPGRVTHIIRALVGVDATGDYGSVTRSACSNCHAKDIANTTLNTDLGLKMSHVEPAATSIRCVDCHKLAGGIVSVHNAGMDPCLRCHDAKTASSDCSTCHDKQVAAAARSRTTSMTAEQITDVRCGGCHDEKKSCDPCHGTRMPHTREFMAYAHARAGAVDFWYNGGKGCAVCHTSTRRPCTKCHSPRLGRAHTPSMALGHTTGNSSGCSCHQQWALSPQRDFCKDVCHTPAAIAGSPR
ncbi:MAG: hypothetical protein D9V44_00950 [Actinobacteria bacterium]|nr:MAG: hypothetical protein D9V44_00950 [Actinomycetota bacterium]